jgi:protein arginine kinase
MFEELTKTVAPWMVAAPGRGAVVASRVRLSRNLAGLPFAVSAPPDVQARVVGYVHLAIGRLGEAEDGSFVRGDEVDELDRSFLVERRLVSSRFGSTDRPQAVYVARGEDFSLTINEDEHVNLIVTRGGFSLQAAWARISAIDDMLVKVLAFAFDEKLGYLTSNPYLVGTGLTASVLMHLPALVITRDIDDVLVRAGQLGLSVRGFQSDGTSVHGNLFELRNQGTLGRSEEEIVASVERIARTIGEEEAGARQRLMREARTEIEDKVWRAFGILRTARILTESETLNLLSAVRLGHELSVLPDLPVETVNELMLLSQPAHLQKSAGRAMSSARRDRARAELIRDRLKG